MSRVSTYLNFLGRTEEAFNFYKEVFGTEFIEPIVRIGDMPMPPGAPELSEADRNAIMHIELPILAGLGIGALSSQLGSVTVSSAPDEQSGEVGALQNTVTNLGASIGTALAGAVLIAALSASFRAGISDNPAVPEQVAAAAEVELSSGVPFISDAQLSTALDDAGVPAELAAAVVDENTRARIDGLREALAVLAGVALVGLFFTRSIPTEQPRANRVSVSSAT